MEGGAGKYVLNNDAQILLQIPSIAQINPVLDGFAFLDFNMLYVIIIILTCSIMHRYQNVINDYGYKTIKDDWFFDTRQYAENLRFTCTIFSNE